MTTVDATKLRRLLYVTPEFPKPRHGFEANELMSLMRYHEVLVVSLRVPTPKGREWLERGFPEAAKLRTVTLSKVGMIIGLLKSPVRYPGALLRLVRMTLKAAMLDPRGAVKIAAAGAAGFAVADVARRDGSDWVHADFASAPATSGMVAALGAKLPFSFMAHAFDVFSNIPAGRATEAMIAYKLANAELAFAGNSAALAVLERIRIAFGLTTPCFLKRNGVPLSTASAHPPYEPSSEFRVVGLGGLVPKKGFDTLIRAVAQVRERVPNATLVIHGDGPERENLIALGQQLAVPVEMPGGYTYDELPRILARASVVSLASRTVETNDADGVPTVFIEALAAGRPVVGTNVGAIHDLISDGETGLLVPPNDPSALAAALLSIHARPDRARRMAEAGRDRVRSDFTSDASAAQFIHILDTHLAAVPAT